MSNKVETPQMGRYCKAYLAKQFRQFPGWRENLQNLRQEVKTDNKKDDQKDEQTPARTEIQDDDVLYLQENYVVTDDIFKNQYIIFDQITDEWKTFCHDTLKFEIPTFIDPKEIVKETENAKNS